VKVSSIALEPVFVLSVFLILKVGVAPATVSVISQISVPTLLYVKVD